MVIKTCKCVCMNTSFKAFSDENKDVILSQNKCFNHPTTTQLPGALPPGTPSELCLRPVRGREGVTVSPKSPACIGMPSTWAKAFSLFLVPHFNSQKLASMSKCEMNDKSCFNTRVEKIHLFSYNI